VRSSPPRATRAARVIRELAAGTRPSHAAVHALGWWRRPDRLLYAPPLSRQMPESGRAAQRPVVVLGATGTLGSAFKSICKSRGLNVHCAGRADTDITQPESVGALLDRIKPWAVVNATGYVRVDDAERDRAACFEVNTNAAVSIASACQARQLPLVTFSSDLVFDGNRSTPYTENDEPCPLNVYGASKAEAERRVREVMPGALIIRTSAFFGPWDRHNFVAQTLRAIQHGRRFLAANDIVVSPTYVPDLVNASLDLLIDGETGIWHLANGGATTTWFAFAREAAAACGERPDLIEGVSASALDWPAPRPPFSALTSIRGAVMRSREEALSAFAAHCDWREYAATA
jgi:dTDP-4-dehydrorhamnose reductase